MDVAWGWRVSGCFLFLVWGVEVGRKRDGSGRNDERYEGVEGALKGRKK